MSAATTYGFVADPGTQQSEGELPEITQRLNELARELHITIYGISGYRTPAHSVAVGGYANDPHTQGLAEDIGVDAQTRASAGQLTNKELASVGLYRPFDMTGNDPTELNHIQLLPTAANRSGIESSAFQHSSTGGGMSVTGTLNNAAKAATFLADPAVGVSGMTGLASEANQVAGNPAGHLAGEVASDIGNEALGYVEPKLEQGALYFVLIIGGVALAGYGLVKMLEPTGVPQAASSATWRVVDAAQKRGAA